MSPKLRVDGYGWAKERQGDSRLRKKARVEVFLCRALGKKVMGPKSAAKFNQKGIALLGYGAFRKEPYIRFDLKPFHQVSNHVQIQVNDGFMRRGEQVFEKGKMVFDEGGTAIG